MTKPTDQERCAVLKKWSETPAVNPRYKGATPMDVARALVGKKPVKKAGEEPTDTPDPTR